MSTYAELLRLRSDIRFWGRLERTLRFLAVTSSLIHCALVVTTQWYHGVYACMGLLFVTCMGGFGILALTRLGQAQALFAQAIDSSDYAVAIYNYTRRDVCCANARPKQD
jgi:hypothetical protein